MSSVETSANIAGSTITLKIVRGGSATETRVIKSGSHMPWWARLMRRNSVERIIKGA